MSTVEFGFLEEAPLRDAWAHEAHGFTPWLAENLGRISAAIGIPLELDGVEVPVGRYSADILATNPVDGSKVLIENQLEHGDHSHLGQILTYLTGLEAQTVVWVAKDFTQEHLSALRWLNQHTVSPFAFIAVKLRVVRIGQSPYAPLFEVVERPNDWDRTLQETARESRDLTDLGSFRRAFWSYLVDRTPAEAAFGRPGGDSSRWRVVPETNLVVVQYLALPSVGVFVRGAWGAPAEATEAALTPHKAALAERLDAQMHGRAKGMFFNRDLKIDTRAETNWPEMAHWLVAEAARYASVIAEVVGADAEALRSQSATSKAEA